MYFEKIERFPFTLPGKIHTGTECLALSVRGVFVCSRRAHPKPSYTAKVGKVKAKARESFVLKHVLPPFNVAERGENKRNNN